MKFLFISMECKENENVKWPMESSKSVEEVEKNDDFKQSEQDSIELCRFLHVLRTSFEKEPILLDTKAKGTVKCDEDVQKLIKRLKALGYFFSIRTSGKKFDGLSRLMVINKKIPPSSHPYRVLSHTYYCCSLRSRETEDIEPERIMTPSSPFPKCRGMMEVRQVETFTTVHLPKMRRRRGEILSKLRRKLMRNPQMKGNKKYEVVISLPKTHNHSLDVKGKHLSDEVRAALHYILRSGTTSVEGIQEKIYRIVDREFENDSVKPSRDNIAFYPSQKVIYNHLRRDGIELKRIHRENSSRLMDLKNRTRDVLASLAEKIESCSDIEIIFRVYGKIKSIETDFDDESLSDSS